MFALLVDVPIVQSGERVLWVQRRFAMYVSPFMGEWYMQACGLRWAKRNSTAPSRKEKKLLAEAKKQ
jgi:hypothetical protein